MDVDQLLRLKGIIEGSEQASTTIGGQGLVASYGRIREQVGDAISADLTTEFNKLFPAELRTAGRPWGAQAGEVKTLLGQMAGWVGGIVESTLVERRIQAEAEGKAREAGSS